MFAARHHWPNGYLLSIISTHWQLQSSVIKCQLGHCNIVLSEISFMISQKFPKTCNHHSQKWPCPCFKMHQHHGSYQHFPILLKHAFQVIILCILHAALGKSNYAESVPEPFDNSAQTILFYSYDNIYKNS